jgi:hypothetical protein
VVAALGCGRLASAHPEFTPTRSNRYTKVTLVGGGAIRIAYTVMVGELPADAARRAADRNGDGQVSDDEARAWAAALQAAVGKGLRIEVDGTAMAPIWDPPLVGGFEDRRVGPLPFSIDLIGHLAPGRGRHTVRLDDTTPLDEIGDSEVRLEEAPGVKLVAAWHAREDGRIQTRFAWSGPRFSAIEDRSIGFRYEDGGAGKSGSRRRLLPFGLVGGLVGVAVAAWLVTRARRTGH